MASAISNLLKIHFNYKPTPTICCFQKQILEQPHSLYYPFPRRKKLKCALFYKFKMYIKQSRLLKAGQKCFRVTFYIWHNYLKHYPEVPHFGISLLTPSSFMFQPGPYGTLSRVHSCPGRAQKNNCSGELL